MAVRFGVEPFNLTEDGGVVEPKEEFRVEVDFAVGTVPLEPEEESVVRKLALDLLRRSLRKVIIHDHLLPKPFMRII